MKPNKLITSVKLFLPKMIIVITALILVESACCYSQSNKTGKNIKTNDSIQTKNEDSIYLDKKDPIFISIKGRAIADLKESTKRADPESPENKLRETQMKEWPQEKLDQLNAVFEKSITDYADQTHFNAGMFMLVFDVLGKMDHKELMEEYDIRILNIGDNQYVAEFWEDGIAVNSEAHAIAYAHELANSERAKKNPGSGLGDVKVIKKNYANTRKSIKDGKHERYTKVMALLYTLEKDDSITFHDPGQAVMDFK